MNQDKIDNYQDQLEIYADCHSKKLLCSNFYYKEIRTARSNAGLCIVCGLKKDQLDKKMCNLCLDKHKFYARNIRAKREEAFCCIKCGIPSKYTRCDCCHLKMTSTNVFGNVKQYVELQELFVKQEGKCKYTRINLVLQENAQLDHIIPRAKGGVNTIDNLQWLHEDINKIKYDLSEDHFLKLAKIMSNNKKN